MTLADRGSLIGSDARYSLVRGTDGRVCLVVPRAQERYACPDPLCGSEMDMSALLDLCIERLTPSREIALYEGNDGDLYLYVTERGEIVYAHSYYGQEARCAEDIRTLLTDTEDAPYSWDGHDDELAAAWEEISARSPLIYRHVPEGEEDRHGSLTDLRVVRPGVAGRTVLTALGIE